MAKPAEFDAYEVDQDDPLSHEGLLNRFMSHVDTESSEIGCWLWTGALGGNNFYGQFMVPLPGGGFRQRVAHRLAYRHWRGIIPEHLQCDHLCVTPRCVNPEHLELVTQEENNRRKSLAIVECVKGHPFDDENTYYNPRGQRECKECRREATRQWRARNAPKGVTP